jgi:hypothetical protein
MKIHDDWRNLWQFIGIFRPLRSITDPDHPKNTRHTPENSRVNHIKSMVNDIMNERHTPAVPVTDTGWRETLDFALVNSE